MRLIVFVFYAAFNYVSVISRRFLGKLSVILVHWSWHQPVSRIANPQHWAPRRAAINTNCKVLEMSLLGIKLATSRNQSRRSNIAPSGRWLNENVNAKLYKSSVNSVDPGKHVQPQGLIKIYTAHISHRLARSFVQLAHILIRLNRCTGYSDLKLFRNV